MLSYLPFKKPFVHPYGAQAKILWIEEFVANIETTALYQVNTYSSFHESIHDLSRESRCHDESQYCTGVNFPQGIADRPFDYSYGEQKTDLEALMAMVALSLQGFEFAPRLDQRGHVLWLL